MDKQTTAPHDLARFEAAQEGSYESALAELRRGRKQSHWMWFVFPQFAGLGFSQMSVRYAIKSLDEARAYLAHPVLGPRLVESADAVLAIDGALRPRDLRIAGRHEAAVLGDAVRRRLARGLRVPPAARTRTSAA